MNPSPNTTAWCAGLPMEGPRPLTAPERDALRGRTAAQRRAGWLIVGAAPVALAVLGAMLALLSDGARMETVVLVGVGVVFVALPLLGLLARDRFRNARALGRDAVRSEVLRFSGVLEDADMLDEASARLVKKGWLREDTDAPQWLEVLPESGLVWEVNGVAPPGWNDVKVYQVAETPAFAAIAAEWTERVSLGEDGDVYLNQRDLSEAEHRELNTYVSRTLRACLLGGLLMNLWFGSRVVRYVLQQDYVPAAIAAAIVVWTDWKLLQVAPITWRMRQDSRLKAVVITRLLAGSEEDEEGAPETLTPPVEFLPFSGVPWTENGRPAGWRKTPDP